MSRPQPTTSMRPSANRRETVWALHWDQRSSRSQAARRATHSLARGTEAAQGLSGEVQKGSQWPNGQAAGGQQAPGMSGLLPAGSSR